MPYKAYEGLNNVTLLSPSQMVLFRPMYYLENEEHPEASAEGGNGEEVADAKPVNNSQGHRRIKWNWVD